MAGGGHSVTAEGVRGQSWEKSLETVYAFRENLSWGEVYSQAAAGPRDMLSRMPVTCTPLPSSVTMWNA